MAQEQADRGLQGWGKKTTQGSLGASKSLWGSLWLNINHLPSGASQASPRPPPGRK